MALCGRKASEIGSFSDATCIDPGLRALRDKIRVVGDRELTRGASELIVSMKDGVVHRQSCDVSQPNRDLEDQGRRIRDKFSALASPVIGIVRVREVIGLVGKLESLDRVDDLIACCDQTR